MFKRRVPEQKMYRQGDLLIKSILKIPNGSKELDGQVIAYGEHTGHTHQLDSDAARVYTKTGEDLYFTVAIPTTLTHDEHGPIELDTGAYQVVHQREFIEPKRPPQRNWD